MLIIISPPANLQDEIPLLIRLFEAGAEYFHLRKPGLSAGDLAVYLRQIPEPFHTRIILHTHYELLEEFNLKGIHIKRDQVAPILNESAHKSTSCHAIAELAELDDSYTYAFLSPVFDSISKQGYRAAFALQELQDYFGTTPGNTPVIALGGLAPGTIQPALAAGFDGVALLGCIWEPCSQGKPEQAMDNFTTARDELVSCSHRLA
jgi:thiamine-phosphate pyrophosphorylase